MIIIIVVQENMSRKTVSVNTMIIVTGDDYAIVIYEIVVTVI